VGAFRNTFACLVHESQECVVDLVRNLRALDPCSTILLYNGGRDPDLLRGFPFERYGAVVHPGPRPLAWGWLHDFALDCIRFARQHLPFDTLTVVDSDQLATRPGYSDALARFVADRPRLGLIASAPGPQPRDSIIPPVVTAFEEFNLWRPFVRRFPDGEAKFVHWSFWPGTVFARAAALDLVDLVDGDPYLREILARSRIWASEEVVLPTLVALLGYEVAATPFSADFVRYQIPYTPGQVGEALGRPDVYWAHPIIRHYGDGLRRLIREHHGHYERAFSRDGPPRAPRAGEAAAVASARHAMPPLSAVLEASDRIDGWLEPEEADLLFATAACALAHVEGADALVEVGSYCGRGTVVLAMAARALRPRARVYAIDPHDGIVGALDRGLLGGPPSLPAFRANMAVAGVDVVVEPIVARVPDVPWGRPIALLLIDGLHDYANVARDFFHFEPWLVDGGFVAFHDAADYFPGVPTFVNELVETGGYRLVDRAGSLVVLRREPADR
jgi:hypothetical protein